MRLHPTTADDLQIILGWVKTNQKMVMWSGPTLAWPLDHTQLVRYLDNPNRIYWSAVDSESQGLVGHASLLIDNDADLMRIGFIIVNPQFRVRGAGRELVTAVVRRGFEVSTLPIMKLGVSAHNTAALSLYEDLGFSRTGAAFPTLVDQEEWEALEMARPGVIE